MGHNVISTATATGLVLAGSVVENTLCTRLGNNADRAFTCDCANARIRAHCLT
jgi:hypothetical protein